jgi:hypothetical protein
MGSIDRAPGQIAWSGDGGAAYVSQFDLDSIVRVADSGTVTTFATGVDGPTGLLFTKGGRLLVVSYRDRAVYEADAGGDLSDAPVFADGFGGPRNLVQLDSGEKITNGGDVSGDSPHATEQQFMGLAVDGSGRMLASDFYSGDVFDITASGDHSGAEPFATNLTGFGDTALDTAPEAGGPSPKAVPGLPALVRVLLAASLAALAARWIARPSHPR